MRTISYKVSYEKMISRLPAMFAYLDIDEQGTCKIVKATNGKQGDYGRIIANVFLKDEWVVKDDYVFIHECKDGTNLKIRKGEKTYRTLIETYYKAIKDKEWERNTDGTYKEPFLAFMEKGIGLKYVGLSEEDSNNTECGVTTIKKFPLAPDYIYLGEAKTLYNKMIKMKKQLIFWEEHTKLCAEDKKYYQRLKEEFEMRNGDNLINKLAELIKEAEEVATEYLGYTLKPDPSDNNKLIETNLTLDFNVNLVNTIKDLGLVTPYIEEWVAGKRYYKEDVVYHIDGNGYGMTWYCKPSGDAKKDEFGRPYTEGFYEENTELIFFDDGSTITIGGEDIETPKNWIPQTLNWVNRDEQEGTKVIEGTCNSHLTSLRRFTTYLNRNDEVETPDNYTDWLWYYRKGMVMNREEKYDEMGNLAVMYGKESGYADGIEAIINEGDSIGDNIIMEGDYAVNLAAWGDVITDITANNNEEYGYGTITFTYWLGVHLKAKKDDRSKGDKKTYVVKSPFVGIFDNDYKIQFSRGDIITEEEFKKIKTEAEKYCEEVKWYSQDDDGNYKYYFKGYEPDVDIYDEDGALIQKASDYGKNQGVKYVEKYIYYMGDIDMEVLRDFYAFRKEYKVNDELSETEYSTLMDSNKPKCKQMAREVSGSIYYLVIEDFDEYDHYVKGQIIKWSTYLTFVGKREYDTYTPDPEANKKKCKCVEETIWTLKERGKDKLGRDIFENYITGKYDKDYKPDENEIKEEDTDAPYYYRLYEKMEFYTGDNIYSYNIRIGNRINKVPFLRTNFTTTVDITHVDIEERPLIRYDYYNGVSFQPSVNEDVYIERGVTQAFEKHIKFSEIKTFEDLENYANGGFFVISKENIDLG